MQMCDINCQVSHSPVHPNHNDPMPFDKLLGTCQEKIVYAVT